MPALLSKALWLAIPCAAAIGGWFYWHADSTRSAAPRYRTAPVERRDVRVTISASGTIEPEEIVDVGAQVAGRITAFGHAPGSDQPIDYGSVVEPGTILARIDDALFVEEVELAKADLAEAQSQLAEAESGVHQAEANLLRAKADVQHQRSRLAQAQRDLRRVEDLRRQNAVTEQEADTAASLVEQAQALVAVADAAVAQAQAALEAAQTSVSARRASVARGEALLRKAETNLGYATIKSPIRGVIVDRRVNIGQTVVSNLNAPSLFLIAKDLRQIEVWASVNEADIGAVRVGLPVEFTVDAFPQETFRGTVKQVRLNATMTQSVVTYTVVVSVDNAAGKLLPYLTANLRFLLAERPQVIAVPAAALRWRPKSAPPASAGTAATPGAAPDAPAVWVLDAAGPRRVPVTLGASDGAFVEVLDAALEPGQNLIVGEVVVPRESFKNPFAPSLTQGLER